MEFTATKWWPVASLLFKKSIHRVHKWWLACIADCSERSSGLFECQVLQTLKRGLAPVWLKFVSCLDCKGSFCAENRLQFWNLLMGKTETYHLWRPLGTRWSSFRAGGKYAPIKCQDCRFCSVSSKWVLKWRLVYKARTLWNELWIICTVLSFYYQFGCPPPAMASRFLLKDLFALNVTVLLPETLRLKVDTAWAEVDPS